MTTPATLALYQVDAFASAPFTGNPACVVPLDAWPADCVLQAIAAENNVSETAFFISVDNGFQLRWFTPTREVALCGHATLATAFVLWERLGFGGSHIRFETDRSGWLEVTREDDWLWLDLPVHDCTPAAPPPALVTALGRAPQETCAGPNWLLRYADQAAVAGLRPDLAALGLAAGERCVIATAPAAEPGTDFVSRFFAPQFGIGEDPVTGSAHCMLAPFWGARLGKTMLAARQISARGGALRCRLARERVQVAGRACLYLEGRICLPPEVFA